MDLSNTKKKDQIDTVLSVSSNDILKTAALNYEKLVNKEYRFTVGNKKKEISIRFVGCHDEEFTHIYGLDHLDDLPRFWKLTSSKRRAIFKSILNDELTINDLNSSSHFDEELPKTYNPLTKKGFTISERINGLQNLEAVLDQAGNCGTFFKWDNRKPQIRMPDGTLRITNIKADYLLKIAISGQTNYYIFLFEDASVHQPEVTRLKIHSAFQDGVDLASGQQYAGTILQLKKYDKTSKIEDQLYINKNYAKNIENEAKK